jgi:hypothetical protein
MELLIWNVVLSFLSAIIFWVVKSHAEEVKRIQILLNRTREEICQGVRHQSGRARRHEPRDCAVGSGLRASWTPT